MTRIFRLKNGLTVATELNPSVYSMTLGFWVKNGSRYESDSEAGLSHMIEHMLFKGTETRSALELAEVMEAVGGTFNAFTSREFTCYYTKALADHTGNMLDLLTDMLRRSKLDEKDIESERKVVMEEYRMYDDAADDLCQDLVAEALWGKHPLGRNVVGTQESIRTFNRARVLDYYQKAYAPENIVLSAVGNFDMEKFEQMAGEQLSDWTPGNVSHTALPAPKPENGALFREKDIEQCHIALEWAGPAATAGDYYAFALAQNVLGGGMTSRLFQEIREKHGLVYSVYTAQSSYKDAGSCMIYAGTGTDTAEEAYERIMAEVTNLCKNGVTPEEFEKAKAQLKGNFLLSLESTNARMNFLAKSVLYFNRDRKPEEVTAAIDALTLMDVNEAAVRYFGQNHAMGITGPKKPAFMA